jgi:hypothetical protein
MKIKIPDRGFSILEHKTYGNHPSLTARLAQQSSAIGDYKDSLNNPGSSFLWIGDHFHLNREEVREFIGYLQIWLDTGSLIPAKNERTNR